MTMNMNTMIRVMRVPAAMAGPAWQGVISNPASSGFLKIGVDPVNEDPGTGWYQEVEPLPLSAVVLLLNDARWEDEISEGAWTAERVLRAWPAAILAK